MTTDLNWIVLFGKEDNSCMKYEKWYPHYDNKYALECALSQIIKIIMILMLYMQTKYLH